MAKLIRQANPTSVILRVKLMDSSSTTGAGLTGLSSSSAGLIIATLQAGEAAPTLYTQAAGNIESIATLGTFAAPSTNKCRFKEIDSTNMKGVYEIQIADARFNGTNSLLISVSGATNLAQADFEIQCENIAVQVKGLDANVITATSIQDNAITAAKLADSAITAAKIASDAITAAKIADNAITSSKLADAALTAAKIATDAITSAKIAADAITSAKIQDGAIGASKLADAALTLSKLASDFRVKLSATQPDLAVALASQIAALNNISSADAQAATAAALAAYNTTGVAKESSVLQIQNNTSFVASIAEYYLIPAAGLNVYRVQVAFYDEAGNMEDPDSNDFGLLLKTADDTNKNALLFKEFACSNALDDSGISTYKKLVRQDTGLYYCFVKIASTETAAQLMYNFALDENSVRKYFSRTNMIAESEPGTVTLADNSTNADVVAKSLKSRNVSGTSPVTGSVYTDLAKETTVAARPTLSEINSSLNSLHGSGSWQTNEILQIYVDNVNGNDANDGLSFATAKASIANACALFSGSVMGKIYVAGWSGHGYSENVTIPNGVEMIGVAFTGAPYINGVGASDVPSLDISSGASIRGFRVTIYVNKAITNMIRLRDGSRFEDCDTGANMNGTCQNLIYSDSNTPGTWIKRNFIGGQGKAVKAFYMPYGNSVEIEDNVFHGMTGDVLDLTNGGYTKINNNTFALAAGKYGLQIKANKGFSIQNNVHVGGAGLYNEAADTGDTPNAIFNNEELGSVASPQTIRDALKLAPSAGTPAIGSIDQMVAALFADSFDNAGAMVKFVGQGGSDSNTGDGFGAGVAYATIAKAVAVLSANGKGGKIFVGGGVYEEDVELPDNVSIEGVVQPFDDYQPEIRGSGTGSKPSLTMGLNSVVNKVRVGHLSNSATSVVKMKDGSKFTNGSTGGIDGLASTKPIFDLNGSSEVEISSNWISGSFEVDHAIAGQAYNSKISGNTFGEINDSFLTFSGAVNDVEGNTFIGIPANKFAIDSLCVLLNAVNNNYNGAGKFYNEETGDGIFQNNEQWSILTFEQVQAFIQDAFNKEVTTRTAQGNPKVYKIGTGTNRKTVTANYTLVNGVEKVTTETVS